MSYNKSLTKILLKVGRVLRLSRGNVILSSNFTNALNAVSVSR